MSELDLPLVITITVVGLLIVGWIAALILSIVWLYNWITVGVVPSIGQFIVMVIVFLSALSGNISSGD